NRFVAGFIGTPAMNLIDGDLMQDNGNWNFRQGGLSLPVAPLSDAARPGPAAIGLRPEHVHIGEGPHEGTVQLVEQTGHENVVVVRTGDVRLTARTPSSQSLRM